MQWMWDNQVHTNLSIFVSYKLMVNARHKHSTYTKQTYLRCILRREFISFVLIPGQFFCACLHIETFLHFTRILLSLFSLNPSYERKRRRGKKRYTCWSHTTPTAADNISRRGEVFFFFAIHRETQRLKCMHCKTIILSICRAKHHLIFQVIATRSLGEWIIYFRT